MRYRVAVLLFDNVEVLDFAGPFEVFGVAGQRDGIGLFDVYTVAQTLTPVQARNNLSVNPDYAFDAYPTPDILVVPGGYGTRREMNNDAMLAFLKVNTDTATHVLSVCSGALMMAKAGLLTGLSATTHHGAIDDLRQMAPETEVIENARYVDNGQIVLSAGISAGIDASLYLVSVLHGQEAADETARYMEYDWSQKQPKLKDAA